MKRTKVFILYTGGTIGMAPKDPKDPISPLVPKPFRELKAYMPGLKRFERTVEFEEESPFDPPLDSSDVKPKHWIEMAKCIRAVYDEFDGFVILHGTDTMAYTASGLSFIFENLSKPIVVTGSQLPISDPRTDAVLNFTNAICLAGYKAFKLPKIPEVVICFADKILRGNRATKVSSTQWAGFDSPNSPPLGRIGEHITINTNQLLPEPLPETKCILHTDFVENVMNIGIFPGFKASHLRKLIEDKEIQGVIIRTFGAGNAPRDEDLLDVIETATKSGKIILSISQCVEGMVEMGLYESSSVLLERGVVSGLDMTAEAALAKLMSTLGREVDEERIIQLQVGQRGEQSENLFDLRYGGVEESDPQDVFTHNVRPDRRFDRKEFARAVVRFSDLCVVGAKKGDLVGLNIFMNKPLAGPNTPETDDRCVATLNCHWEGEALNLACEVTEKARAAIGEGNIYLSVVSPDRDVKFFFRGLYLALFSRAQTGRSS